MESTSIENGVYLNFYVFSTKKNTLDLSFLSTETKLKKILESRKGHR